MKALTITILFTFIRIVVFGQSQQITDSLKHVLTTVKDDTTKVMLCSKIVLKSGSLSPEERLDFGLKGYELAKSIHFEKGQIECGLNTAFIMVEKDYFKALSILNEIKPLCEKNNDTTNLVKLLAYTAYGYNYFDTERALYYYRTCLNLMKKAHISEAIIPIYTIMGYCFKDAGMLDSALVYLQKGYKSSLSGVSPIPTSNYPRFYGEIYYKKGNKDLAMSYFRQSITENKNPDGETYLGIARIFKDLNQLDSAKFYAKAGFNILQSESRTIYIIQSAQLLFDLYKDLDPKEALKYLVISTTTKDSLFNQSKSRQVEKLYFEEQERQRKIEAEQIAYQNQLKQYSLLAGLGVFLLIAFILYRNNRQKQKANQVLENTLFDLKTSQAQLEIKNRDLEIEAALERVRSASLAIQQSHELEKVIVVLFEKLMDLGIPFDATFIYFFDKPKRNIEAWVATKLLPAPIKVNMPYDEDIANNPIIKDLWHAIETGENGLNKTYKEKDKDDYYCYEAKYNPTLIPESVTELQLEAESWTTTFASEKNSIVGFDSWSGQLTTTEDFQILIRFAKVFEQAYTRFLDLQKAEAQAREAQIEASLERIRSRAMAMSTSEELNTLIGFIYVECTKLNMHLDRGFIMTFNKATKDAHWWMVSADESDKPLKILVKYHEYAPNLAILKGWEEREQRWSYVLEGNNKKTWDDYQFANDLSQLPDFVKDNMRSVKSVILNASFQNFGCIMLSSFEPLSEDHFDLLMRLSKVFDLTYTRFLDLQLREQNAIRLIEEKQKLEFTLSELRATQAQLIQKEKLASLGELTAGIAHEIQNPLNFVNNFSELSVGIAQDLEEEIKNSPLTPNGGIIIEDKTYFNELISDLTQNQAKINHHGKRASSIVKGMLEHSRASTGVRELTDINQLADEYLRLAYHGLRAKDNSRVTAQFNCDYELIADENLPPINVVPQDIGRVLLNLINNAFYAVNQRRNLQAEASGGLQDLTGLNTYQPKVSVTTQFLDNQIEIRVQDNGTGMSEVTKAKIFQPFFTTKPTGEGTGLGLSLAYDIVTKGHGGTIEVESVEGQGTAFIVKLPL